MRYVPQKKIDGTLKDLPSVFVISDDILFVGYDVVVKTMMIQKNYKHYKNADG